MTSLSTFTSEANINIDDHALFAHMKTWSKAERERPFARAVLDFYAQKKVSRKLARHPDGLPKLTFRVFDCQPIRHYLDDARKAELGKVLNAIGRFAVAPRKAFTGSAKFAVDGDGDDFALIVDYARKAVFMTYVETVWIDFRDEATRNANALDIDRWAKAFGVPRVSR